MRAGGEDAAGRRKVGIGRRIGAWFAALLLVAAGLGVLIPGVQLIGLGGSPYYVLAGLLALGAGVLGFLRRGAALWLYAALLVITLAWSLWEIGLDPWALMPRLFFWIVGGVVVALLLGWIGNRAQRLAVWASVAVSLLVFVAAWAVHSPFLTPAQVAVGQPQAVAGSGDWTHYGNTLGGTRFSPLAEITPANVANLEKAWEWRTGALAPGANPKRAGGLQVNPIMVDGMLYACKAYSSVFALDPVTGKQIWRYDPPLDEKVGGHSPCRGIAYFRAPEGTTDCPTRLIFGTIDNKLTALDARTGKPCASFGTAGSADLSANMGKFDQSIFHPTSPPTIVRGTAVIGHYVADNKDVDMPGGVIRGYDAVTGKIRWAFDPGRPNDQKPLEGSAEYTHSTPNSWTVFSGDEALGLVYVPLGNGSPDFVGGHRTPETDRFGASLVALDAATGAVRWTFQAVRHDLWDYDLAAQPVLIDMPVGNARVPALILPTKTGQLFVLDRRTGQPITKVEERRVPASVVGGERASPTQPFSTGMPDMAGERLAERDMWGITPFDQLWCRIQFKEAHYEGMFTPPRAGPTIRYPGELGGIDWGSVSVDESRGILMVHSNHMADYDRLVPRAEADRLGIGNRGGGPHSAPGAKMAGTGYAIQWGPFINGFSGVPCQRPPYGFLTAIDLKSRKVLWQRTLGDARNSGPFGIGMGLPLPLGAPNIGGSVVTAGGVTFIAATQDEMFRAIETATGKVLWQVKLPASGHATPTVYRGRDGHQYVVIPAGGSSLKDKPGDWFIAYRLKQ